MSPFLLQALCRVQQRVMPPVEACGPSFACWWCRGHVQGISVVLTPAWVLGKESEVRSRRRAFGQQGRGGEAQGRSIKDQSISVL